MSVLHLDATYAVVGRTIGGEQTTWADDLNRDEAEQIRARLAVDGIVAHVETDHGIGGAA